MKKLVLFLFLVPSLVNAQPLSLYSTDSYAYFGTLANASTFLGRQNYECKITNTGKLEGKGDGTSLPTWDISTDADTKRIKIGGGSDTNTTHGGRLMMHGIDFSLSLSWVSSTASG